MFNLTGTESACSVTQPNAHTIGGRYRHTSMEFHYHLRRRKSPLASCTNGLFRAPARHLSSRLAEAARSWRYFPIIAQPKSLQNSFVIGATRQNVRDVLAYNPTKHCLRYNCCAVGASRLCRGFASLLSAPSSSYSRQLPLDTICLTLTCTKFSVLR